MLSKQLKRLERVLTICNATLPPSTALEIARFFRGLFRELSGRHTELGLAKVAVDCLIAFLMHHGGNMQNQLAQVRGCSCMPKHCLDGYPSNVQWLPLCPAVAT